jgi:integrase
MALQRTRYPGVYKRHSKTLGTLYDWKAPSPDGKPHWKRGYTKLGAAVDARARYVAEVKQGLVGGRKSRRFADFFETDWLPKQEARVAQGELLKSTCEQYTRDGRNHLLPTFGRYRLEQIGVEQVERFRDRLSASGKANDSVRRIVNTLGYVLDLARKWRLIPYNPVSDVEKPRPKRRTPVLPTVEQIENLADCAARVDDHNLIRFAAFAGPRLSEVFALRWENCDLTEGAERIWIVEHYYKGDLVPGAKTLAGSREIILSPEAAQALREQSVAQQVDGRPNPHGLIFPAPGGGYWRDSNWNRRVWQPARTKAGLPDLMFHTLRYFFISTIRAQGLATPITEQLAGHVDERTHRGYTRPLPGTEQVIRAALAHAFEVKGDGRIATR